MLQKRLIEHVRTLYRSNDLTGRLPLGELRIAGAALESYKLAFTPGLFAKVYRRMGRLCHPTRCWRQGTRAGTFTAKATPIGGFRRGRCSIRPNTRRHAGAGT